MALLAGTGLSDDALNAPGAEIPLMKLLALAANLTRQRGAAWPIDAVALVSADARLAGSRGDEKERDSATLQQFDNLPDLGSTVRSIKRLMGSDRKVSLDGRD